MTEAQLIEYFHLTFLQVLSSRLNQRHYVVKGGANLRYFFNSHRYSQGIDFDAVDEEPWRLADKVDEVLEGPTITVLLRGADAAVAQISKPKQTETTQRWKVLLAVAGRDEAISTKIEFSRRDGDQRWLLDAVPDRVVAPYALRPPTLVHYTAAPATEQKIEALALRSETQARDVFDLELLFRTHPGVVEPGSLAPHTVRAAMERCLELPFGAFESQVVPFLEPELAELYGERSSWEEMQAFVIDRLAELDEDG